MPLFLLPTRDYYPSHSISKSCHRSWESLWAVSEPTKPTFFWNEWVKSHKWSKACLAHTPNTSHSPCVIYQIYPSKTAVYGWWIFPVCPFDTSVTLKWRDCLGFQSLRHPSIHHQLWMWIITHYSPNFNYIPFLQFITFKS